MDSTSNDLSHQLAQVKNTLSDLTARITNIETVLKIQPSPASEQSNYQEVENRQIYEPVKSLPLTSPLARAEEGSDIENIAETQISAITESKASDATETGLIGTNKSEIAETKTSAMPDTKEATNLESTIGSLWLNRLGIGSLVIGVALFVLYSFPSWPALAKILAGLLTGLALTFGGEFFAKKLKAADRLYGEGLIGGGWALTYFSTYAGHYIQSVQVVQSPAIAALMLLAVCGGSFFHAREKNSQVIAILSVALSFYTICIQPLTTSTLGGCLLMALAAYALIISKGWYKLLFWTNLMAYCTYLGILNPGYSESTGLAAPSPPAGNAQTMLYLFLFWIGTNISIFCLKEDDKNKKDRLTVTTLLNGLCFGLAADHRLELINPLWRDLLLLAAGFLYLASYKFAKQRGLNAVGAMNVFIGSLYTTIGLTHLSPAHFTVLLWLVEIPTLVWLGLKHEIKSLRFLAIGLSLMAAAKLLILCFSEKALSTFASLPGFPISETVSYFWLAVLSMAISAGAYHKYQSRPAAFDSHGIWYYWCLCAAASFLLPVLIEHKQTATNLITLGWAVQAAFYFALGTLLRQKAIKCLSLLPLFTATTLCIFSPIQGALAEITVASIIFAHLFGAILSRKLPGKISGNESFFYFYYFVTMGAAAAFMQTWLIAPENFLAIRWAGEAAVLVSLGLWFKDRYTRIVAGLWYIGVMQVLLFSYPRWDLAEALAVVAVVSLVACLYRLVATNYPELCLANEVRVSIYYQLFAIMIIFGAISAFAPTSLVSAELGVFALLLCAIGFMVPDKVFRVSGLLIFGDLIFKLLFIDLAAAKTEERIISFILAGIALLIASYCYTRYGARLIKKQTEATPPEQSN